MVKVRPEAAGAAAWWAAALEASATGAGVSDEQAGEFERALAERIEARCEEEAWKPDIPTYGTCGRQVASSPRLDEVLVRAGRAAGVSSLLDRLPPAVMWVNPGEVLVRVADGDEPTQVWP